MGPTAEKGPHQGSTTSLAALPLALAGLTQQFISLFLRPDVCVLVCSANNFSLVLNVCK